LIVIIAPHSTPQKFRGGATAANMRPRRTFSVFLKRGMVGTFITSATHSICSVYVTEFAFRFNNRTALGANDKDARRDTVEADRGQAMDLSTASLSSRTAGTRAKRFLRWRKNQKHSTTRKS
jgi:hypothetical protein